jgi:hypothetical protein
MDQLMFIVIIKVLSIVCLNQSEILQKKHNAVCFHKVRESVAAGMIRVAKIDGKENLADLFTKRILPGIVRKKYLESILF